MTTLSPDPRGTVPADPAPARVPPLAGAGGGIPSFGDLLTLAALALALLAALVLALLLPRDGGPPIGRPDPRPSPPAPPAPPIGADRGPQHEAEVRAALDRAHDRVSGALARARVGEPL